MARRTGRRCCWSFDPRLREGGDRRSPAPMRWRSSFDPRLREGGDTWRPDRGEGERGFDPRLREGGDGSWSERLTNITEFRSTPPRRRRPSWAVILPSLPLVSIHASAKEATRSAPPCHRWRGVSIHASAKEATRRNRVLRRAARFRSTPPRRRRRCSPMCPMMMWKFRSTPPRRRRLQTAERAAAAPRFDPRLREGGDPCCHRPLSFLRKVPSLREQER